jgi:hypothetical protein
MARGEEAEGRREGGRKGGREGTAGLWKAPGVMREMSICNGGREGRREGGRKGGRVCQCR